MIGARITLTHLVQDVRNALALGLHLTYTKKLLTSKNDSTNATIAKMLLNFLSFWQMFVQFLMFSSVFGRVFRTCSDVFGCVRMRSDALGCIWMRSDAFGHFRKIQKNFVKKI